jgi:hypothetical protein
MPDRITVQVVDDEGDVLGAVPLSAEGSVALAGYGVDDYSAGGYGH